MIRLRNTQSKKPTIPKPVTSWKPWDQARPTTNVTTMSSLYQRSLRALPIYGLVTQLEQTHKIPKRRYNKTRT